MRRDRRSNSPRQFCPDKFALFALDGAQPTIGRNLSRQPLNARFAIWFKFILANEEQTPVSCRRR
jgi:hypothetical protein